MAGPGSYAAWNMWMGSQAYRRSSRAWWTAGTLLRMSLLKGCASVTGPAQLMFLKIRADRYSFNDNR